jgi:hypothetical protein
MSQIFFMQLDHSKCHNNHKTLHPTLKIAKVLLSTYRKKNYFQYF